ncbi:MAG TPA: molecular chaperone DnaJ [Campylobacterales bacterium]|nr:molecular chaperone DnaJ [Campylobacterales bacterium]HIP60436.1 molecular chaperone DnaJ [Campylobacterales bacterium]
MKNEVVELIHDALQTLNLPSLVSYEDIKNQYYLLSKRHHPDLNQEDSKMVEINEAYAVLKQYVFHYRFSFSDEEIMKQFPEASHASKFRF